VVPSVVRYAAASGASGLQRCTDPISSLNRGETSKPRSARSIAPRQDSAQGRRPWSACASASIAIAPGTPVDRPLFTASQNGIGRPSASRNMVGVAPAGATSRPSYAETSPVAAS
jgi:hypothetical protein